MVFRKVPSYVVKARSSYQLVRSVPRDLQEIVGKKNWREPGGKTLQEARARVNDFIARTDLEIRVLRGEQQLSPTEQIYRLPITTNLNDPEVAEMLLTGAEVDPSLTSPQKALQVAVVTGQVVPPPILTARDLVAMATALKQPAARTLQSWNKELDQFLSFCGTSLPTSCTKEQALAYRQHLLKRTSPNTTKTKLAYLTGLWTVLTEEKPGAEHIFKGLVKRIKAEPKEKVYEINPVETWTGSMYVPIFRILYFTGARVGEIAGLRGEDILDDRILIRPWEGRSLKTKASSREVPIHPSLQQGLEDLKSLQGPVWPSLRGDGLRWGNNLGKPCRAVTGVNPHGLRHRAATRLREAGFNEAVIGRLLGHTPQTVTGSYGSIPWERLVDAVGSL